MDRRDESIDTSLQTLLHGMSGSMASAMSTFLLYPVENIKTRLQISENKNPTGK